MVQRLPPHTALPCACVWSWCVVRGQAARLVQCNTMLVAWPESPETGVRVGVHDDVPRGAVHWPPGCMQGECYNFMQNQTWPLAGGTFGCDWQAEDNRGLWREERTRGRSPDLRVRLVAPTCQSRPFPCRVVTFLCHHLDRRRTRFPSMITATARDPIMT